MQSKLFYNIGKYRHYNICRFCKSDKINRILDFGYMPLAGGFLRSNNEFTKEYFYPLGVYFCNSCFLVQTSDVIDSDTLFKDYFYYSSKIGTLNLHFENIALEMINLFPEKRNPFIVEIGSNDGVLINNLLKNKIPCLGIDPAQNIVRPLIKKGLPLLNSYFTAKLAKKIANNYQKADIICGFNVLAHIEDMHDVIRGIKILLKEEGYLIFEVHYLDSILRQTQYDMIYHEHQYYYSLLSLNNFFRSYDMEIFEARKVENHAGSIRIYVKNILNDKKKVSSSVKLLMNREMKMAFNKLDAYKKLDKQIKITKNSLLSLLKRLKQEGKIIVGYGASGRGTIISNYCGLNENYLDYVVDDSPLKQNCYMPGTHLKIYSPNKLKIDKPDYVLLFAWSFLEEIMGKSAEYIKTGGKFIVPLPKVEII